VRCVLKTHSYSTQGSIDPNWQFLKKKISVVLGLTRQSLAFDSNRVMAADLG